MFSYNYESSLSDDKIEEKARGFGMHFKDECKAFFERDEK